MACGVICAGNVVVAVCVAMTDSLRIAETVTAATFALCTPRQESICVYPVVVRQHANTNDSATSVRSARVQVSALTYVGKLSAQNVTAVLSSKIIM